MERQSALRARRRRVPGHRPCRSSTTSRRSSTALDSPSELPVAPRRERGRRAGGAGRAPAARARQPAGGARGARRHDLLLAHATHIGHPRFWGYVCGSQAPIGALADLLAASVNQNVGGYPLGPMAAEIERQTVRWIAELLGYPSDAGGLLVSGGNMANFIGFLAARRAQARGRRRVPTAPATSASPRTAPQRRTRGCRRPPTSSASARRRCGGSRRTPSSGSEVDALRDAIAADRAAGARPFLVIGTAGSVSTGAVDPLARAGGGLRRRGALVPRRRCVRRLRGLPARGVRGSEGARARRLGRRRPAQVAVRPGRGRLRAGPGRAGAPRRLQLPPALLPPARGHQLLRVRATELTRLQGAQGLARAPPGWAERLRGDDRARTAGSRACCTTSPTPTPSWRPGRTRSASPPSATRRRAPARRRSIGSTRSCVDRLQAGGEAFVSNAIMDGRYCLRGCASSTSAPPRPTSGRCRRS